MTAQASVGNIVDDSETNSAFCYVPERNNVSYSQVLENAKGNPAHVFKYGDDPLQFGELWLPKLADLESSVKAPLVIFVHGGCWLNAFDLSHAHSFVTALSKSGYAVWSIEYRRTGDIGGGWPGSYEDVLQAINFALNGFEDQAHLLSQIDFNDVRLLGHSAGGHLALLAASNPRIEAKLTQVIGLAAITDPASYSRGNNSCESATQSFMGGSPDQLKDQYRAASLIGKTLPQNSVLLIGGKDVIVNRAQSELISASVANIDDAGHFDFIDPHSFAFNHLLKRLGNDH